MTIPSNQIGNKYPLDNEIPNSIVGYDATNHTMQCIPGITVVWSYRARQSNLSYRRYFNFRSIANFGL